MDILVSSYFCHFGLDDYMWRKINTVICSGAFDKHVSFLRVVFVSEEYSRELRIIFRVNKLIVFLGICWITHVLTGVNFLYQGTILFRHLQNINLKFYELWNSCVCQEKKVKTALKTVRTKYLGKKFCLIYFRTSGLYSIFHNVNQIVLSISYFCKSVPSSPRILIVNKYVLNLERMVSTG